MHWATDSEPSWTDCQIVRAILEMHLWQIGGNQKVKICKRKSTSQATMSTFIAILHHKFLIDCYLNHTIILSAHRFHSGKSQAEMCCSALSEFWPHCRGFIKSEWRGSQSAPFSTTWQLRQIHCSTAGRNNWETIWLCLDRGICGVWE